MWQWFGGSGGGANGRRRHGAALLALLQRFRQPAVLLLGEPDLPRRQGGAGVDRVRVKAIPVEAAHWCSVI